MGSLVRMKPAPIQPTRPDADQEDPAATEVERILRDRLETSVSNLEGALSEVCYMLIYCSLAYSAWASVRIGVSGSASFHRVRKSR